MLIKLIFRKRLKIRNKKIVLHLVIAFIVLMCLGLHFCWFTRYQAFRDMTRILESRSELNATVKACRHDLVNQMTQDQINPLLNVTFVDLHVLSKYVVKGGSWAPADCLSKYRVNIVVPYRNRPDQLDTFLHYLHRFLVRQEIDYRIVVIEQSRDKEFNRGKLLNIGFTEMERRFPSHCYIFHDVDLIPTNLNNIYACSNQPRHMSSAIDIFNYRLPYCRIFGGAVALTRHQFLQVNGYSNSFFGWGGEDDDFYFRVSRQSSIIRFESAIARYVMLDHPQQVPNPMRHDILRQGSYHYSIDGLNSLNYVLLNFELKPLYTWIVVDV